MDYSRLHAPVVSFRFQVVSVCSLNLRINARKFSIESKKNSIIGRSFSAPRCNFLINNFPKKHRVDGEQRERKSVVTQIEMLYQSVSIGKSRLFYPYNIVIKMCSYFQRDLRWGQLKASSTCRGQQLKPFVTRSLKRRACEKPFKSNRFGRSCCNLQAAPF